MVMSKAIKATGAAMASIALTLSMAPMAFADEITPNEEGNYMSSSKLSIEAEPTLMNITVPTQYDVVIDSNGKAIMPSNATITNNSRLPVNINSMTLTSTDGWYFDKWADCNKVNSPAIKTVDTKRSGLSFYVHIPKGTDSEGVPTYLVTDYRNREATDGNTTVFTKGFDVKPLPVDTECPIKLEPNSYGVFTQPQHVSFDMTIDFGWAV